MSTLEAEYLSDEDFSRLNGAYHRIDAAEEFRRYVTARLWERYRLGPGDSIQPDGRIVRAGSA